MKSDTDQLTTNSCLYKNRGRVSDRWLFQFWTAAESRVSAVYGCSKWTKGSSSVGFHHCLDRRRYFAFAGRRHCEQIETTLTWLTWSHFYGVGIRFLSQLQPKLCALPVQRSPSRENGVGSHVTDMVTLPWCRTCSNTLQKHLEFRFYLDYSHSYVHFRFIGRHLEKWRRRLRERSIHSINV